MFGLQRTVPVKRKIVNNVHKFFILFKSFLERKLKERRAVVLQLKMGEFFFPWSCFFSPLKYIIGRLGEGEKFSY
jgi:hypothetical protein